MYTLTYKTQSFKLYTQRSTHRHVAYKILSYFQPTQRDKHHFSGWYLAFVALFLWELGRNQHLTNYLARARPLLAQLSSFKRCIITVVRPTRSSMHRKIMAHTHSICIHLSHLFYSNSTTLAGKKAFFLTSCKKSLPTITHCTGGKHLSLLSLAVPYNDHYHGRLHSQPTAYTDTWTGYPHALWPV